MKYWQLSHENVKEPKRLRPVSGGKIRPAKHGCENDLVVVSFSVAPTLDKYVIRTTLYVAN